MIMMVKKVELVYKEKRVADDGDQIEQRGCKNLSMS